MGSPNIEMGGPRSPNKKRSSTFDSKDIQKSPSATKRGSCPTGSSNGLDSVPSIGADSVAFVDDEYSDSETEDFDSDEDYDDDDDEYDHYDAGDSDLSVETTAETSSELMQHNMKGVMSNTSFDEDGGMKKVDEVTVNLTDVNLTAVSERASGSMGKFIGGTTSSNYSSSLHATVGAPTVGTFTDTSAYNSGDDEEDAGIGLAGEEGKAISKLFKDNVDLSAVASAGNRLSMPANGTTSPPIMKLNSRM